MDLARNGFPLPRDVAQSLAERREDFALHSGSLRTFFKEQGAAYAAGETFRQPELAASLERIQRQGRAGFYAGETADLLVAEMVRGGGLINHEDLANYRSVWRQPILGSYRGFDIISMPPPSSGGVLLVQMLNMPGSLRLSGMGFGSAAAMHHMIEAERRAYADRAEHLGDPDFTPVPVARLIDKAYARSALQISTRSGPAARPTSAPAPCRRRKARTPPICP